jgi:hypothetical protein
MHRLRKRLWKKVGQNTEFPIFNTTAYIGPVYYNYGSALHRHIAYDPINNFFLNIYVFELSAISTPAFGVN